MSRNRVIGRDGRLPWRLSADLRRFRRLTMGHHLIMGRKTYESIGRALPGRISIVLTRQVDWNVPGLVVAHSLPEALRAAGDDGEVFVIGGAELYQQALPLANRIYLTQVEADVAGEAVFPRLDESQWTASPAVWHAADQDNEYPHTFRTLKRSRTAAPLGP